MQNIKNLSLHNNCRHNVTHADDNYCRRTAYGRRSTLTDEWLTAELKLLGGSCEEFNRIVAVVRSLGQVDRDFVKSTRRLHVGDIEGRGCSPLDWWTDCAVAQFASLPPRPHRRSYVVDDRCKDGGARDQLLNELVESMAAS